MVEDVTDQQVMAQLEALAHTAAVEDEKHNAHKFIHAVATSDDTTKVGNLKEEEVGIPKLSQRTLKELSLYCRDIAGDDDWADYFDKRAEILTSTSLSKDAKLLEMAIIQRREVSNVTPQNRKVNKSWFKRKEATPQV